VSVLGDVRLQRGYYYCPRCRAGHFPWDATLGLSEPEVTPGAAQLISLAGCLDSFIEAHRKILPRMAGIRVAESTVERITEGTGARAGKLLAEGVRFGPAADWKWQVDAEGRRCAYVSVDATGVPQQGPGGVRAEGRMPYVAMVYNPVPEHYEGRRPEWQSRYLAGLYPLDDLGRALRRQAAQVGWDRAERWIALSDGGSGLEDFLRVNFPLAELILDFYHPAEKLCDLAKLLCPGDEDRAEELGGEWCHTMKHEGGQAVLELLDELELGRNRAARAARDDLLRYIGNNVHRMNYPRYLKKGWQIGSGSVESACKTVVGQRLKGAGMRWGEDGTDALCHLRALYKSEPVQWEAFWNRSFN
jgi:hypothetical protein